MSEPTTQIAEALCAADSILSLLRYRHGDQLDGRNREDVNAAGDKLEALRYWYERALRPCPAVNGEGHMCDRRDAHDTHTRQLSTGATATWVDGNSYPT